MIDSLLGALWYIALAIVSIPVVFMLVFLLVKIVTFAIYTTVEQARQYNESQKKGLKNGE